MRRPRQRCPGRRPWSARSSLRANSTTTRRNTSTTDRRCVIPADVPDATSARDPAAGGRGLPGDRLRGHGPGRLPAVSRRRPARVRQRDQHHSGVHHDQHVREALGGIGRAVSRPARSADRRSRRSATPRSSSCARATREACGRFESCAGGRAGLLLAAAATPGCRAISTGVDGLVRVYDYILDARFDQADAELDRACPPAPAEACDVLGATATWWRILLDPESRALDEQLSAETERRHRGHRGLGGARSATAPRRTSTSAPRTPCASSCACCATRSSPPRAMASASGRRSSARSRSTRPSTMHTLASACTGTTRTSRRRRRRSSASCCCCPAAIGKEGLAEMLRTRARGATAPGRGGLPAADHLSLVREARPPRRSRCSTPSTSAIRAIRCSSRICANVRDTYQHDLPASLCAWRELLAAAREQRVNEAALAEAEARLGDRAATRRALPDRSRARAAARRDRRAPGAPVRRARLRLSGARRRRGPAGPSRRGRIAAYRLAESPPRRRADPHDVRSRAADRIRQRARCRRAREAYRLSLDGFRKLERRDAAGAVADLAQSVALDPGDPASRGTDTAARCSRRRNDRARADGVRRTRSPRARDDARADRGGGVARSWRAPHERLGASRRAPSRTTARPRRGSAAAATCTPRPRARGSTHAPRRATADADARRARYSPTRAASDTFCRMRFFDF